MRSHFLRDSFKARYADIFYDRISDWVLLWQHRLAPLAYYVSIER